MSNVPSFETVACDEIVRIDKLLQSLRVRAFSAEEAVEYCNREMNDALARVDHLKARAEKAERERDEAYAKKETFANASEHYCKERDDAMEAPARIPPRTCGACEGPLTCALCTSYAGSANAGMVGKVTSPHDGRACISVDVDHEARIKELEARVVPVFCARCGAGYASVFDTCPACHRPRPLNPTPPVEMAQKLKDARRR
jgi:hypothetical protein